MSNQNFSHPNAPRGSGFARPARSGAPRPTKVGASRSAKSSAPRTAGSAVSRAPSANRSSGKRRGGGENIHVARFIQPAAPTAEQVVYEPVNSFDTLKMHLRIKSNIAAKGISELTPIQDQSIPAALAGRDIIGIANTGTGKTLAFSAPVINKLLNSKRSAALILAPTRELAQQIDAELCSFARGCGIGHALIIGGAAMRPQTNALACKPKVVIGTPGRIKDHLQQGNLDLSRFDTVVLDEFDRMLDMGFIGDIRRILGEIPTENRQSLFFSATLDSKIRELSSEFTVDPLTVEVSSGETASCVNQDIVKYNSSADKIECLYSVLRDKQVSKVLIFDETKHGAERLGDKLIKEGFPAGSIHGGKSQGQRERMLREFREGKITVLVATDVAARGIDVKDITHVINYAIPRTYTDYIHRVGRAGRAGRQGYALTFVEAHSA
jgi:superfamily II DNA/RNA helicase